MTLHEFYCLLKRHDWSYEYADDFGSWSRGKAQQELLERTARESADHARMYEEYRRYALGGGAAPQAPVGNQREG